MAISKYVLCTVAFLGVSNAAHISSTEDATSTTEESATGPKWPTEYYFKGEIMDAFNAVLEPFEIWYNEKLNRSRMDVYNGVVKKYYWGDKKKLVVIHPSTTDTEDIVVSCDYVPTKKKVFNILPIGLVWILTGTGTLNGAPTQIWEAAEPKNKSTHHHTLVTRKEGEFDIPLSLETLKYKLGTGMTVGHLSTVFSTFKATVGMKHVDIEKDKFKEECEFNPFVSVGEGLQHLRPYIEQDVDVAFNRYKNHHKKAYNENEHQLRQEIFELNWRRVDAQNRKNLGYKLELNEFADWTEDELKSLRGALPSKQDDPGTHPFPHTLKEIDVLVEGLPDEYDLRIEGDLPVIKNQQACGSCWAFATTATVEAAIIKRLGGVQLDLSEQSLVDCGWPYGTLGCNGGFLDSAFKYVHEHGIPTEAEYGGYMHEDGYCHISNMTKTYHIKGYTRVTPHSVNALKYAVYTYGPVEVTMHASEDLTLYSSGIFYDMSCVNKHLNHAVVVVGYGSQGGEPYWIIRNSWGETWGEDGYVLMSAKDNNCLILDSPYYPIV